MHPVNISGNTEILVVVGDPVRQVKAPALFNQLLVDEGVDAVLVPAHVRAGHLPALLEALRGVKNLRGVLVTVPHKASACSLADTVSAAARACGAANALRLSTDGKWHADNFDGAGFVTGLEQAGRSPRGRRVALVGAGGAGRSVAVALLGAGVGHLSVADLDSRRLDELAGCLPEAHRSRVRFGGRIAWASTDIAVNATPLGMGEEDALPFDPHLLPAHGIVADIVMKPAETKLLRTAAAHGLSVHRGTHMLEHQMRHYLSFFGFRDEAGNVHVT